MRVRKVDANGDMTFGHGQRDYWRDVPDAPAQLAGSRLRLETGQWFLDRADGIDYRTKVLGKRTEGTRDIAVRTRILGTEGVTAIASYGSVLNRDTRGWNAQANLDTRFGRAQLRESL